MEIRNYGLIGKSLQHSFSASYFAEKFARERISDCSYRLYPLDMGEADVHGCIDQLVRSEHLLGFNVTFPYKQWVMGCLDELSEEASAIGAVNCVKVEWGEEGRYRLKGYNTDAQAFGEALRPLLKPCHESALVLGTGGAARAVGYALQQMGIPLMFVSRQPGRFAKEGLMSSQVICYDDAGEASRWTYIIVNATPVGTFPNGEETPWQNLRFISSKHLCFDLVYNPAETRFLRDCGGCGAAVCNGLEMLHRQAELGWQIWQQ